MTVHTSVLGRCVLRAVVSFWLVPMTQPAKGSLHGQIL